VLFNGCDAGRIELDPVRAYYHILAQSKRRKIGPSGQHIIWYIPTISITFKIVRFCISHFRNTNQPKMKQAVGEFTKKLLLTQNQHLASSTQQAERSWLKTRAGSEACPSIFLKLTKDEK
jgi:hypothetical protein